MGDLTDNFSRREFSCKCGCGFDTVDFELLFALQHCADRLKTSAGGNSKVSVIVSSGCRCEAHNKKINGTLKSQHLYGRAADVKYFVDGSQIPPAEISDFFSQNYAGFGIGTYETFNHIDSRSGGGKRF